MRYKLPEGWKEVKLGEVAKLKNGKKAQKVKEFGKGKYPLYGGNGQYGSAETYNSENSLVIGRVGAYCGSIHKVDEKFWVSDNAIEIKPLSRDILSHEYLYYRLVSFNLNRLHQGTSQPLLNQSILKNIRWFSPPLPEQKSIADTLSSLDDKIELNNKINENLEQQAQAIFKHWFVDFEFPDKNGNPYKSSGGEMVDSDLGMMPKGWTVGKLDDVIELHDSKRIPLSKKQRDIMEKNYPYYGATSVIDYVEDYIFDGTYLLLGEDGSVSDDAGYPILQYVWGKIWVNNHAHVMTGKGVNTVEYLYMLLKNTNVNNIITGAVQKKINQRNLKSLEIIISEEELLLDYIKIIKPIFKKRKLLETQNQKLSQLRDTLLPKLMSGEIRIPID